MAKSKTLTAVQKTNKNNRDRGKAFEKKIAETLGWYRVPLSGSSSLFGWSDVRDSETIGEGIWMGECKTMKPNTLEPTYTIKLEWLDKLVSRAMVENKMPVLFITLYGDTAKFVSIPRKLAEVVSTHCQNIIPLFYDVPIKRSSKNQKNYTIKRSFLMEHKFRAVRREKLNSMMWAYRFEDEEQSSWVLMHLDEFMRFHSDSRLGLVHSEYTKLYTQ